MPRKNTLTKKNGRGSPGDEGGIQERKDGPIREVRRGNNTRLTWDVRFTGKKDNGAADERERCQCCISEYF